MYLQKGPAYSKVLFHVNTVLFIFLGEINVFIQLLLPIKENSSIESTIWHFISVWVVLGLA